MWDGIRALDYLESRTDLIDPEKLGMAGKQKSTLPLPPTPLQTSPPPFSLSFSQYRTGLVGYH